MAPFVRLVLKEAIVVIVAFQQTFHFDPASGTLRFSARTDYDPSAATFLYEIVRQPREQS